MERCPSCGEADSGHATCSRCGTSLLVDVHVEPSTDERVRFNAAKVISALGRPAPAFAAAKRALSSPGQPVVRRASLAFARRVNDALLPLGLKARSEPARPGPKGRLPAAIAFAVALAAAIAAGAALRGSQRDAPQVSAPTPATSPVAPAAGPAPKLDRKKVQAAVVQLSCKSQLGSGFFIAPDRVLTNAHVVCSDETPLKVSLSDGRTLIGKVERRDDWLDWAMVTVSGADNEALPMGDSTVLVEGDPVVLVGSPNGLSFTWHEGKVSFIGRNHLGIAYVQLDATVNPGNSGGPVVNARGEVVAIVSLKVTTTEGIGLALPVEYVEPPEGEALDRWNSITAKVETLNERALSEASASFDKPALIGLTTNRDGLVATIILRAVGDGAPAQNLDVELRAGKWSCRDVLPLDRWVPLEQVLRKQAGANGQNREMDWMVRARTFKDVKAAVGLVPLDRCNLLTLQSDPELVLLDGSEGRDRLTVSRTELAALQHLQGRATRRELESRVDEIRGDEDRELWRTSFADANARIEGAQRDVETAKGGVDSAGTDGRLEYARRKLKNAEERLHAAESALLDLERRAAQQSVPLEWRR